MAHGACGLQWSHGMHMTTLDAQTWSIGEIPGLELTGEDVSLLRGDCDILARVDSDILARVDSDILVQGLIGLIEYSY
jgi:hypothetical protein